MFDDVTIAQRHFSRVPFVILGDEKVRRVRKTLGTSPIEVEWTLGIKKTEKQPGIHFEAVKKKK
jgi:hypothetical protein